MSEGEGDESSPQLRFWESASRLQSLGKLSDEGEAWEVHLVLEKSAPDLFRGRLAFRREDETLITAPVIVEESEKDAVRRAEEMPESMIPQFLVSVRG